MNFLCIYLGERKGGGVLMYVYIWEHIGQPLLQNRLMDAYETW